MKASGSEASSDVPAGISIEPLGAGGSVESDLPTSAVQETGARIGPSASAGEGFPIRGRIRRGAPALAGLSAWLLAGFGVDRLVCKTPESPALLQIAICVVFGLLSCHVLLHFAAVVGFGGRRGRTLRDSWEYLVPVAAYSLLWGRHHFLNFFYFDEVARFHLTQRSPWELVQVLFQPVALGHVMPIAQVYWYAIYSIFHANYIGVAAASFVGSVAIVASAHALIRAVSPPQWRLVSLVPATIVAATPHSPLVTLWKGAGDSLVLTLAFLFPALVLLARVVLGRQALDRRTSVFVSVGLVASVFSSSLVAIVPVYLLPFGLWLAMGNGPRGRIAGRLGAWFAVAAAATLATVWIRRVSAGLPHPAGSWSGSAVLGSLRGVVDVYFPSVVLKCAFLAGSLMTTVWLLLALHDALWPPRGRKPVKVEPAVMLWVLGFEMFLVGTLQVVWARGLVYETRGSMSGYHLFLPFWGLALASAAMLVVVGSWAASRWGESGMSRQARIVAGALAALGLCSYSIHQCLRVERSWPLMTTYPLEHACAPEPLPPGRTRVSVIRARAQLEADLRRVLEGAITDAARTGATYRVLPDLALVDSPLFPEFAFWPSRLNTSPSASSACRGLSRLGFMTHVFGLPRQFSPDSRIRFLPPERIDRDSWEALYRDPATAGFLRKYWPQLDPGWNH